MLPKSHEHRDTHSYRIVLLLVLTNLLLLSQESNAFSLSTTITASPGGGTTRHQNNNNNNNNAGLGFSSHGYSSSSTVNSNGAVSMRSIPHKKSQALHASSMASSMLFGDGGGGGGDGSSKSKTPPELSPFKAALTKAGMTTFILSMCVALPVTLLPTAVLYKAKLVSKRNKEILSLRTGQFCSRWLMRIIPFANVDVISAETDTDTDTLTIQQQQKLQTPEPSIWVCNHNSMLDVFVLLATDKKLRGKNKRPIKIVYWKDLEKNPVTGLLFKMCGFFPVEMEDNGSGNANQYKTSSFKSLLRGIKQAFDEGFDIGILPEGQINPHPEKGLQPVFSGAFTLARMSKRPIRMMGMYGLHKLWHVDGMNVTGRKVKVRAYPFGHKFESGDEFVESFKNIIGHFGAKGEDHPEWKDWLNGNAWNKKIQMESESESESESELAVNEKEKLDKSKSEQPTSSLN